MPTRGLGRAARLSAALSLALGLGACGLYIVPDRYYVVEADQALALARRSGAVLLDVRPPADYAAEHAAGARSIPISQLWARMDELPPEQGALIVLYDDEPARALRAGSMIHNEGYYRVYVSRGGLEAWKRAAGPTASGDPPPPGWGRGRETW